MKNVFRLAIVDPNDASRAAVKNLLLALDMVWLEAECSRYEFFFDVVAQTQPDVALVSLDGDTGKALSLIARVSAAHSQCSVVAISSRSDGPLILQAMRSGAQEFLTEPVQLDDLLAALERIGQLRGGKGDGQGRSGRVIALAGATGGVGTTSLAVNLAACLAKSEENCVVLLDLDLALGDADVCLDIIPDYTILDVVQNISRLDFTLLKRSLTRHSSGVFLLPRPVHMEDAAQVGGEELKRVVGLLKASFTHLVLDLSKSYGPIDLVALELADVVLLVTQLDLPCLRNVVRLMASLNEREGIEPKVKVVVNRQGLEDGQISLKKAQETIGRELFWQIPNDYSRLVEARNAGVPLITHAPRAKITQSILGLAQAIDEKAPAGEEQPAAAERPQRKGLLRFLG